MVAIYCQLQSNYQWKLGKQKKDHQFENPSMTVIEYKQLKANKDLKPILIKKAGNSFL